jgi:N-acetyl-anhydromuramyl-L-alanine amidase AmpD
VVYVGGLDKDGKPKDTRTPEQKLALGKVVKELRQRYPKAEILGHRDLSPDKDHDGVVEPSEWMKACPSFDVKSEIKGWLK